MSRKDDKYDVNSAVTLGSNPDGLDIFAPPGSSSIGPDASKLTPSQADVTLIGATGNPSLGALGATPSGATPFDVTVVGNSSSLPHDSFPQGSPAKTLPEKIGHYKIIRLIGSGGMGAVYEAEQDQPRRQVALKIMRGAIASPQASRRFEYESQMLARLRHPCIAQVYEAGTHQEAITGAAVPYFAMEFIPEAKELTDFAKAKSLGRNERIELFLRICDAVHHGHQRGVIHRDLKPANILMDTTGLPKIIDFGVARASDDGSTDDAGDTKTKAGQLIGTLQYMAPEQCGPDSADIDVRADVYALGVILYELLTSKLPLDLNGQSLFSAAMMVREDAPVRPSTVDRTLRGDLETVMLKALEKDRNRRYSSAADFADDLQRFLKHEPIHAKHIGALGRLTRWVRRNRTVASVVAASTLLLSVTSVVLVARIVRESHRANAALIEAQRNLRAATDNFGLIKGFFASMRPAETVKGLVDVELLLDNATKQIEENPPEFDATEADFREILASAYQSLGKYNKSITHQRRVIDLREVIVGPENLPLADSLHQLAAALWWNGQYDEAAPLYERSLELRKKLHGQRLDAERLINKTPATTATPVDHADIAMSLTHLAACRLKQGNLDEAIKNYRLALDMRRRMQGSTSPEVAASINNLAKCELLAGQYDRAELYQREALTMIVGLKGQDDLQSATAQNNLALCLLEIGKYEEARDLFAVALKTRLSKFNAKHHFVALSRLGLARAEFALLTAHVGHDNLSETQLAAIDKAVNDALDALTLLEQVLPTDHPDIAESRGHVGLMLTTSGKSEAGVGLLQLAMENITTAKLSTKRDRDDATLKLGVGLCQAQRTSEGRELLWGIVRTTQKLQVAASLRAKVVESLLKSEDLTPENRELILRWR